jgi:hypothetical protein
MKEINIPREPWRLEQRVQRHAASDIALTVGTTIGSD